MIEELAGPSRTMTGIVAPAPATPIAADEPTSLTNRRGRTLLIGFTAAHFAHHVITSLLNPRDSCRNSARVEFGRCAAF